MEASCTLFSYKGPDYILLCVLQSIDDWKTVQEFQVSKYDKAPSEFDVQESVSAQDKQWVSKTCHNALKRGALPAQAKANNLDLDDIPIISS